MLRVVLHKEDSAPDISRSPIRVLLVAPSLDIVGGQSVQAARILEAIPGVLDVSMQFLPINPRVPWPPALLRRIKYVRTAVNLALYFPLLIARAVRADILHVFTASYWSYALWAMPAILVGRALGKKVILNYRDGRCEDHLRCWRSALPTMRLAHAIVTPSDFLVDVFARFGLQAQSIVNSIDERRFRWRDRAPPRPSLMTSRSLEPLYNVPCVLRAFRRIQERYPDATLTIAHDGPLRAQLEAEVRLLDLRHVRFVGEVSQDEIAEIYDSADIYVMTPDVDNMPGTLLECMASGLPIVATRAGGISHVVHDGETALLADLDDDAGVAEACFRLLEDAQLASRLAVNGREAVKEYAPERSKEQWVALYRLLNAGAAS